MNSELGPELAVAVDEVFEHLNGNHADSVLFLASHVAGTRLLDAELDTVDTGGVGLRVRDEGGERALRFTFGAPISSTADLQGQLLGRMMEARAEQPDGPLTSIEVEIANRERIPTRVVTVTAVADVGPGMRQITFGGLRGHLAIGPDDFFLVIHPRPGMEHLLDGDTSFADYRELPADQAPDWAYYTCRRWRPEVGELDVWFVLHHHDGAISGWARNAEVGDRVALWGPRSLFEPPEATTALLLVGDETGLGAFAAILETVAPAVAITAVIESDDGEPIIALPERAATEIHWVSRHGADRGTGNQLVKAVAGLDLEVDGLYAYGAGESRLVTAVRKHLRRGRGVPGPQVQMVGYWRRSDR